MVIFLTITLVPSLRCFNVLCCSILSALFSELWNQRQGEINQVMVPFVFRGSVWYGGPESSQHRRLTNMCTKVLKHLQIHQKFRIFHHVVFSRSLLVEMVYSVIKPPKLKFILFKQCWVVLINTFIYKIANKLQSSASSQSYETNNPARYEATTVYFGSRQELFNKEDHSSR